MKGVISEAAFFNGLLSGAKGSGTISMVGNTADVADDVGLKCVAEEGGWGIPVFKPQGQQRLLQLFADTERAKASCGVDLDGCGSVIWSRAKSLSIARPPWS
jgi:hypothetical protein